MSEDTFGSWLKARRGAAGLTLRALAAKAGVGRSTLSDWESGKRLPRLSELETAFDALSISPAERQMVLRQMPSSRALQRAKSETGLHRPEFIERAGHLPHGGDLLKAMRLRKGWTMQDAGGRLGVGQTTVGRWESGEHFPDGERLQTVCFVYGASEAEILALTCGRYSLGQTGAAKLSPEALEHRFRTELAPLELAAELHPGRELDFFTLEAALWTHALNNEILRPLLAEVYAHHASYLRNWRQNNDVYASRCLELLPRTERLPEYAALAVVCVADALMARTRNRRGQVTTWLTRWIGREFPPQSASWLLRRLSGLLCERKDFEGALRALERAGRLPEDGQSEFNQREVRRYHAWNLLFEGQAGKSLDQLPATLDAYAPNRVRDALLRAEGCLKLSKPSEAQDWLHAAYEDIEQYELPHWRHKADSLAREL